MIYSTSTICAARIGNRTVSRGLRCAPDRLHSARGLRSSRCSRGQNRLVFVFFGMRFAECSMHVIGCSLCLRCGMHKSSLHKTALAANHNPRRRLAALGAGVGCNLRPFIVADQVNGESNAADEGYGDDQYLENHDLSSVVHLHSSSRRTVQRMPLLSDTRAALSNLFRIVAGIFTFDHSLVSSFAGSSSIQLPQLGRGFCGRGSTNRGRSSSGTFNAGRMYNGI